MVYRLSKRIQKFAEKIEEKDAKRNKRILESHAKLIKKRKAMKCKKSIRSATKQAILSKVKTHYSLTGGLSIGESSSSDCGMDQHNSSNLIVIRAKNFDFYRKTQKPCRI